MNLKKVIACALLCGMLFSTIPVEAIKTPIDSDAEVDTSEADSEADAQPDTSNRFFSRISVILLLLVLRLLLKKKLNPTFNLALIRLNLR